MQLCTVLSQCKYSIQTVWYYSYLKRTLPLFRHRRDPLSRTSISAPKRRTLPLHQQYKELAKLRLASRQPIIDEQSAPNHRLYADWSRQQVVDYWLVANQSQLAWLVANQSQPYNGVSDWRWWRVLGQCQLTYDSQWYSDFAFAVCVKLQLFVSE